MSELNGNDVATTTYAALTLTCVNNQLNQKLSAATTAISFVLFLFPSSLLELFKVNGGLDEPPDEKLLWSRL